MPDITTPAGKLGYSPDDAAAASGIGRTKIFQAIRDGHLAAHKLGRRTIILQADLAAFLRALPSRDVTRTPEAA